MIAGYLGSRGRLAETNEQTQKFRLERIRRYKAQKQADHARFTCHVQGFAPLGMRFGKGAAR